MLKPQGSVYRHRCYFIQGRGVFLAKQQSPIIRDDFITNPETAKGRLLATAAKLFNQKGYERTTVRDLATAVGIQSGSIFHHFKTKEDILKAVMTETILYNTEKMRVRLNAASNIEDEVLSLIYCELESIVGDTGDAMAVLVYEWRSLNALNQKDILALRDSYEALWLTSLQKAKEEGLISGDVFILRRFLTGALSWSKTWFNTKGDLSIDTLAQEALRLVFKP